MMDTIKRYLFYFGILLIAAGLVYFSVLGTWNRPALGGVIAGGILAVAGLMLNLPEVAAFFRSRRGLYGTNFVVSVVILLAVLSLVNVLAVWYNRSYDATPNKLFSLSDQTRKVLDGLQQNLEIYAFYKPPVDPTVEDLLQMYHSTSSRIHWEIVDPDRKPEVARRYNITTYGTVVIKYGDKTEKIDSLDESKLTSAIIKVLREGNKKIYFLTGHGEKSITDTQEQGYSDVLNALQQSNYDVAPLNLVQTRKVPSDCSVLVIAGPKKPLFPQETEWLEDYGRRGGSLFVMVDPTPSPPLDPLLAFWGIKARNDLVLDTSNVNKLLGASPGIPLITQYPKHPITRGMEGMSVYPLVRSLEQLKPLPPGVTVQPFLTSDTASWGETDLHQLEESGSAEFNQATDIRGPLDIGLTAERTFKPEGKSTDKPSVTSRLAAIGDSDFAANSYFQTQLNGDIFINTVNWLAMDEELISIRPKEPGNVPIVLTEAQRTLVFYGAVFFLPLIPLVIGIAVVVSRRRKK